MFARSRALRAFPVIYPHSNAPLKYYPNMRPNKYSETYAKWLQTSDERFTVKGHASALAGNLALGLFIFFTGYYQTEVQYRTSNQGKKAKKQWPDYDWEKDYVPSNPPRWPFPEIYSDKPVIKPLISKTQAEMLLLAADELKLSSELTASLKKFSTTGEPLSGEENLEALKYVDPAKLQKYEAEVAYMEKRVAELKRKEVVMKRMDDIIVEYETKQLAKEARDEANRPKFWSLL
eukprot:g82372.t1